MQRQGKRLPPTSRLLQRRVLSVAAYAKEEAGEVALPSKGERVRLYGSSVMPIPVTLLPGESEAQYERSLEDWLAAEGKPPISSWQDMPNHERSVRVLFAKTRARAFASGEEIPRHQSPRSPHHGKLHVPKNLNREKTLLYTKEFVDIDEYRRDVKEGKFAKLAAMSQAERTKLIGSPVVPIAVPLAAGESPSQYEARFLEWLKRVHRFTIPQLRSDGDKSLERYYRVQFAMASAFGHERFVPAATGQKRDREIIFGDSVDMHPSKKAANATKRSVPILSRIGGEPREASAPSKVPSTPSTPSPRGRCRFQMPSGTAPFHETIAAYAMCACKPCLLNGIQMMTMKLAGVDDGRAKEEPLKKINTYPTDKIPSYQSEQIKSEPCERTLSVKNVDGQDEDSDERSLLEVREVDFAGDIQSDLQDRASGGDSDVFTESAANFKAQDAVEESCEHQPDADVSGSCSHDSMQLDSLEIVEETQGSSIEESSDVKDDETPEHPQPDGLESDCETVEAQLFTEYEMRNEGIMMKEAALNSCTTRLSGVPPPSLEELTQLHDQNQEIRTQLELETVKRNDSLGRLVVHLWRDDVAGLEAIINETTACDMPPVQRAVHQRCQLIAKDINTHREKIASIKQQVDTTSTSGDADCTREDLLATVERELVELETRRKREIATLIRFDKRLRDAVRRLLDAQRSE